MLRYIKCLLLMLLAATLLACGGSSSKEPAAKTPSAPTQPGPTKPGEDEPTKPGEDEPEPLPEPKNLADMMSRPLGTKQLTCGNLHLSHASAVPGSPLTLKGVPAELGEPNMRVIAKDNPQSVIPQFLIATEYPDEFKLAAPFHPEGRVEGGEVFLELGDGTHYCEPLELTLEELPEADASYTEEVLAELEEWVNKYLEMMGYDAEQLHQQDPLDLDPFERALWLAKELISGDDEASLPVIYKELGEDAAFPRVLKATGIKEAIQGAKDALHSVEPWGELDEPLPPSEEKRMAVKRTAAIAKQLMEPSSDAQKRVAHELQERRFLSTACEDQQFDPKRLRIVGAEELSRRMLAAGNVFDDAVAGAALGATSMINEGRIGAAAGHAGNTLFAVSTVQQARNALEPRHIVSFEVDNVERFWNEARNPNNPLMWSGAKVMARGESFNLARATLESLVQAIGLVPGPVGVAVGAGTMVPDKGINAITNHLTEGSCFMIRAPEYGPIDVSHNNWTEAKILSGNSVEMLPEGAAGYSYNKYRGVAIGDSILTIRLRNGKFAQPDFPAWYEDFTISVEPVNIALNPGYYVVKELGEELPIQAWATGEHIEDPANFSATVEGAGEILDERKVNERFQLQFKSPANTEEFPTKVQFKWEGRTLEGGAPRVKSATIAQQGRLNILTPSTCISKGEAIYVEAELLGFPEGRDGIVWQANQGGSVSPEKGEEVLFTPPRREGTYTVTAFSEDDNKVQGTYTVSVAEECLAMVWVPNVEFSTLGDGDHGDVRCGVGLSPWDKEETLEAEVQPEWLMPNIPPKHLIWHHRTLEHKANLRTQTRHHHAIDYSANVCEEVSLTSGNHSRAIYSTKANGTMGLEVDLDIEGECKEYSDGVQQCASGKALMTSSGYYYLPIRSKVKYRLTAELECEGDDITLDPIPSMLMVVRLDERDNVPMPISGDMEVMFYFLPKDSSGAPMIGMQQFECGDSFSDVITFPASPEGQEHKGFIVFSQTLMSQGYTVDKNDVFREPNSGKFRRKANRKFTMKLTPQ